MLPLFRLQLASNILLVEGNEEVDNCILRKSHGSTVFSSTNYCCEIPKELLGDSDDMFLKKVAVQKDGSNVIIKNLPSDVKEIVYCTNRRDLRPLSPLQLCVICDGSRDPSAYFLSSSREEISVR